MGALDDFDPDAEQEAYMEAKLDQTTHKDELDEILDKYAQDYFQLLRNPTIEAKDIKDRKRGEAKAKIDAYVTNKQIEILVQTCLFGMGGLTPDQQEYIEQKINELKSKRHG